MTNRLTSLSNSDLFQEYNSIIGTEFVKRAELLAEIDRRLVDNEVKFEIRGYLPDVNDERPARRTACSKVADMLAELEPETLWRIDANQAGKLSFLTVGEACTMYRNTAKYGL